MEKLFIATEADFLTLVRSAVREELKLIGGNHSIQVNADQPLNIKQAAAFLDRPVSTLYSLVSKREIPFSKKGKRLNFFKTDLIAWVRKSSVRTVDEISADAEKILTKNKG